MAGVSVSKESRTPSSRGLVSRYIGRRVGWGRKAYLGVHHAVGRREVEVELGVQPARREEEAVNGGEAEAEGVVGGVFKPALAPANVRKGGM